MIILITFDSSLQNSPEANMRPIRHYVGWEPLPAGWWLIAAVVACRYYHAFAAMTALTD